MTSTPVAIDGAHVVTVDAGGAEYASGHVVLVDARIAAVGSGPVPEQYAAATQIDGSGRLVTPGLVNTRARHSTRCRSSGRSRAARRRASAWR